MVLAITGATGYIGTRLISLALERGHDVVIASRHRPSTPSAAWIHFDLSSASSISLPAGTNVIVHLAANTTIVNCIEDESEVIAAQWLIKSAHEAGARFIFVSSQTARPNASTVYGRTKWRIEQEVLSAGGWVVRPGQVYGGEPRGLFGTLVKTVHKLPVLPAFVPAPRIQPIHVDDLTEGLLRIVERSDIRPGVYCLAAPEPVSFSRFLEVIAQSRLRCRRWFVLTPAAAANALAIALGEGLRTRFGLDRLRSLFDLPVMETSSDLKQIGLTLRPLRSGMHPSGSDRRRCLLQEGRALLTYVLKEPPNGAILRRYIRAIELLRGGQALNLPQTFLGCPIFLSLLDKSSWMDEKIGAEFSWRLDAATMLAEATISGAYRFLGSGLARGLTGSLLVVANALVHEILWRMLRIVFSPLVRFSLSRERRGA